MARPRTCLVALAAVSLIVATPRHFWRINRGLGELLDGLIDR